MKLYAQQYIKLLITIIILLMTSACTTSGGYVVDSAYYRPDYKYPAVSATRTQYHLDRYNMHRRYHAVPSSRYYRYYNRPGHYRSGYRTRTYFRVY